MGWVRYVSLLMLLPLSFALVISGDAGAGYAEYTAAEKCGEPAVQAVYRCLGNIVRVVSSVPGEGSTFYKPDGRVIHCPVVAPKDMGGECLQLMAPNYCPTQSECGFAPVPQIFPGQNDTAEQVGDDDYYIIEGQAAGDLIAAPEPEPLAEAEAPPRKSTLERTNTLEAHTPASATGGSAAASLDAPLSYLVYVVLLLGIGSVGLLFFMFRNSMAEEA